jgi:purine-nucleoside phosphorylase
MRVLALDMETAALYATARQNRCQALTLLSVSDVIPSGLRASSQAREQAFAEVIDVVLEALLGSHDAV